MIHNAHYKIFIFKENGLQFGLSRGRYDGLLFSDVTFQTDEHVVFSKSSYSQEIQRQTGFKRQSVHTESSFTLTIWRRVEMWTFGY